MINSELYFPIEKSVISKINRFKLNKKEDLELEKDFKNSSVLIAGGAGSIGSQFCKDIIKYNIKNLFILDKDENQLTELNRALVLLLNKKQIAKINFICSDLTIFNLDKFIKDRKITHYLNFAAIKHVRTEEELDSIRYMFLTNAKNFLPKKKHNLKKLFSISTDKTVNPTSILGITKSLMEANLNNFKKKNNLFVSSVRFANVSFSNGSVLKYVVDRLICKQPFGIPSSIKRFFITHQEASSLCLKSILNTNDGKVVLPNYQVLKKDFLISEIVSKIMNHFSYKEKFVKKLNKKNYIKGKQYNIQLTSPRNHGQKKYEEFYSKEEIIIKNKIDTTIFQVQLPEIKKINEILTRILKFNNYKDLQNYLFLNFKNYNPPKKVIKVSQNL